MSHVTSFAPITHHSARILILGSMPGVASFAAGQYYAHPRNAFWPIMADLFGFDAELPYLRRVAALKASGIALWDVLQSCHRPGSLDAAIASGSRVPNDFRAFFAAHPGIRLVAFNGTEAERSFNSLVLSQLDLSGIRRVRLPSTSPAHAVSFENKLAAWRAALDGIGGR